MMTHEKAVQQEEALYQSLASVECRHVGGSYHCFADYDMEVEDHVHR